MPSPDIPLPQGEGGRRPGEGGTGALSAAPQAAPALPENPTLADYLAYAEAHNPAVQAAHYDWEAARERVPQARALPDPMLSYGFQTMNRIAVRGHEVGLEQTYPWFGKRDLRAAVAEDEAATAAERYQAARLRLAYEVKGAYYAYYYLWRQVGIVRENRDLVKYLEEVARTRYKAAAAGHPDVIRAQVELGRLENELRTLEDLRGPAAARLNAALARPTGDPRPWPATLREEAVDADDERVLGWLREANPDLRALDRQAAREGAAIELARKDFYPDVTLGLSYGRASAGFSGGPADMRDDMLRGMVSVNIPLWRQKYEAAVREAEARRQAALKMRADRENMLAAETRRVLYEFRDASRRIGLYRDTLLPKAREALQATEAAYRTGAAPFADLVDAERMLLEFQLSYERALADAAARLAEAEMLVGREVPRAAQGK